jgi:DNA repair protein RecN (Recombination protein N)
MLCELRVENLLLIERAELRLAPGLNVLTGETGAGKTMLAHALDLLLGGRPRRGIVRPGASEAYVEGTFALSSSERERLAPGLAQHGAEDCEQLVLGRRVGPDGRTRAYLNGRFARLGDLRELACELILFYGQHEHRKLTLSGVQLQLLDDLCGEAHLARRDAFAATLSRVRELELRLKRAQELSGARERELAFVDREIEEIEGVAPTIGEHAELLQRRGRLRRLESLHSALGLGSEALSPEESELPGAAQLAAVAAEQLESLHGIDSDLDTLGERTRGLVFEAQDIAQELHRYRERLEHEEGELQATEERLSLLEALVRRHGGTVEAMLDRARDARARREELTGADEAADQISKLLQQAHAELGELSCALGAARREAAGPLALAVREQLAALAMPEATFEVELSQREPCSTGADAVELVIAPNPGVAAGPLREIASGGELSRVMLALSSASSDRASARRGGARSKRIADGGAPRPARPIMVFDEVDAGIGGQTARAVGERLRTLAERGQVLCITHLPQIASLADRHFTIAKDTSAQPTSAVVLELQEPDVVSELVRMLGAEERDPGARRHAQELRKAA